MYKYKGYTPGNKETRAQRPKQAQTKAQKKNTKLIKQELNKRLNRAKTQKKEQTNSQQHKYHLEVTFQFIVIKGPCFKLIEQSRLRIMSIMVQATFALSLLVLLKIRQFCSLQIKQTATARQSFLVTVEGEFPFQ